MILADDWATPIGAGVFHEMCFFCTFPAAGTNSRGLRVVKVHPPTLAGHAESLHPHGDQLLQYEQATGALVGRSSVWPPVAVPIWTSTKGGPSTALPSTAVLSPGSRPPTRRLATLSFRSVPTSQALPLAGTP